LPYDLTIITQCKNPRPCMGPWNSKFRKRHQCSSYYNLNHNLSLSPSCLGVEKKIFKDYIKFHIFYSIFKFPGGRGLEICFSCSPSSTNAKNQNDCMGNSRKEVQKLTNNRWCTTTDTMDGNKTMTQVT